MDQTCIPCRHFFKWLSIQRHTLLSIVVPEFTNLPFNCTVKDKIPYDLKPIMLANLERTVNFTVDTISKRYANITQFKLQSLLDTAGMALAANWAVQNRIAYQSVVNVSPFYPPTIAGINATFAGLLNSAMGAPIKNLSNILPAELAEYKRLNTLTVATLGALQLKSAIEKGAVQLPDRSLCLYANGSNYLERAIAPGMPYDAELMAGLSVAVAATYFIMGTIGVMYCKFNQR
jgi:hypothetical protein